MKTNKKFTALFYRQFTQDIKTDMIFFNDKYTKLGKKMYKSKIKKKSILIICLSFLNIPFPKLTIKCLLQIRFHLLIFHNYTSEVLVFYLLPLWSRLD